MFQIDVQLQRGPEPAAAKGQLLWIPRAKHYTEQAVATRWVERSFVIALEQFDFI